MKRYLLGEICEINPRKKTLDSPEMLISFVPMDAVSTDGAIDTHRTISAGNVKNYSMFQNGDVLFAKITPCMENGKGGIVNGLLNGYGAGSTEFIVVRPKIEIATEKWVYLFLSQSGFRQECRSHMTGSAGQKRVPPKYLRKCEIPVPPLDEQARIVSRIEELFSELDNGVETLKKTKQQLVVYRRAVLKECFSVCSEVVKAKDVCTHITDGDHSPPPKAQNGIPFIMISNIKNHVIDWEGTNFVGEDYYSQIGEKRTPQKGDVLYTVTGSFGIPVLIDFDKKFCFQRHVALLRPNERIDSSFLYYALQTSQVFAQASKRATGTAQKTVGLAVLRTIEIPFIDSINEQRTIVSKIEERMTVCDSIEQTIDAALQQAEALRQSILKKAFEGKLT